MTPPRYLMARTEVPVTMGRRVRSLVRDNWDDVCEDARDEPPDVSERDIVMRKMMRKRLERIILVVVWF